MSNGLTEEVATGKQWYVLNAWSQHDKQVYEKLVRRNITAFLPVTNVSCIGRGGKRVIRPISLMPGYIFAQCDADELQSLKIWRIPDAHILKGTIGDDYIRTLREQIEGASNGHVIRKERPASFVHKRVQITDGPFATFEGLATREDRVHGLVTIEVQILGRPVPTEVPVHQLQEILL